MNQTVIESDVFPYTTRLQKGGAALDDMRMLVRTWQPTNVSTNMAQAISENSLGKETRMRMADTFQRIYLPRYVNGTPREAWRLVRLLEDRGLPIDVIRPIYYWITARNEPLIYDYVSEELAFRPSYGSNQNVRMDETVAWITGKLSQHHKKWSPIVTLKVARGLLAALRDFRILEGRQVKRIAPVYIPVESFVYLSFILHMSGSSGERLVNHKDWQLFLLRQNTVEQLFLEAHQQRLLSYHAAGRIVRIEFPANSLEEMADVIARK
jgi:hypothetical protein